MLSNSYLMINSQQIFRICIIDEEQLLHDPK